MVEIARVAKSDLKQFELEVREKILDRIEELLEEGVRHQKVEFVRRPELGLEFQRLKLKGSGLDHRVYFVYRDGTINVFAVRHRDFAYSGEDFEEVAERLEDF